MKKSAIFLLVLGAAGAAFWFWFTAPAPKEHESVSLPPNITWLDTGLSREDQAVWHHLSEGSELMPMSVLEALKHPRTGKPFLLSLADYGFMLESTDPHKLPVGWTTELRTLGKHKVPFIGINCSACHSGELHYQGNTVRIDGAPNLFALEQFFHDLQAAAAAVRTNSLEAFKFIRAVIRLNHDAQGEGEFLEVSPTALQFLESVNEADGLSAQEQEAADLIGGAVHRTLERKTDELQKLSHPIAGDILKALVESGHYLERRLATLEVLAKAIDCGVDLGPGRGDSFGIIRDLLFPFDGVRLDAPVSTPHLFGFGSYGWIHWDGNTQSVMQRNLAQAIALGADYDPVTHHSSVLPHNLHQLEKAGRKLKAPAWPENIFGAIDRARAQRGRDVFQQQRCAECHTGEKVYSLAEVGTSPVRSSNFALPLAGRPFPGVLADFGAQTTMVLFQQHNIPPEKAKELEPGTPEWRATGGYVARSLAGLWATAPFLHNGSVPSVYELLQPAAKRSVRFSVGQREFDPKKLGFILDVPNPDFILDTTIQGNGNQGHEFGVNLPEESKLDLIEYLKTL